MDDNRKVSGSGPRVGWERAGGAVVAVAATVLLGLGAFTGGAGAVAAAPTTCASPATCGVLTEGVRWQ